MDSNNDTSGASTAALSSSGRRRTLMERQSDKKSDGGEAFRMSERIIKNTEAMTASLRAQRGKCQSSIKKDREDLEQITRTLDEYEKGYEVVTGEHARRVGEREGLIKVMGRSKSDSRALVQTCASWRAKNRRDTHRASRMIATSTLRAARGFSCDAGTTCTAAEARRRGRRMNSAAAKTSIMDLARPSTSYETASGLTSGGSAASLPAGVGTQRPGTSLPASDATGVKSSYF